MAKKVYEQSTSMQHWNDNQCCAIDVETTGLISGYHEIAQIAVLSLDSNFRPNKSVMPFCIHMRPDHIDRADRAAMRVNSINLIELCKTGFPQDVGMDMFEEWVKTLNLRLTRGMTEKRIFPLGQNYQFDKGFIVNWLGQDLYEEVFDARHKDTLTTAQYLNDQAAFHNRTVPYSKTNLTWLAKIHKVPVERAHSALDDAAVTAEVYRRMCQKGLL